MKFVRKGQWGDIIILGMDNITRIITKWTISNTMERLSGISGVSSRSLPESVFYLFGMFVRERICS